MARLISETGQTAFVLNFRQVFTDKKPMDLRFRRLFLVRFSLVLWGGFFLYTLVFLGIQLGVPNAEREERRRIDLEQQQRLALDLLEHDRSQDLVESLRHALRMGRIDFFAWKKDGVWTSGEGRRPELGEVPEAQVSEAGTYFVSRLKGKGPELYFGYDTSWKARARYLWRFQRWPLYKDLLLLVLGLGVILYVFFRDLAKATPVSHADPAWKEPKPRLEPKVLRPEAPVVSGPPEGELRSGIFAAARFALPAEEEMRVQTIKTLFSRSEALVRRYGGRVVAVEQELFLFLFGEDAQLACAAARDLAAQGAAVALDAGRAWAVPLHGIQASQVGEVWTKLAAVLANQPASTVRVGPNVGAPGLPLFRRRKDSSLEQLVTVEGALARAKQGEGDYLKFFRSDEDLSRALNTLAAEGWELNAFLAAVGALRSYQCTEGGQELVPAYSRLLEAELKGGDRYRLSSTLALATHCLSASRLTPDLEKLFLQAVASEDRRIRANAIEVFIHFFPDREFAELKGYVRDVDNRVSANALIKSALERFDEKLIRTIEARLKGGSVAHVASALYAIGEIAAYYRRTDPMYLATKLGFLALFDEIPDWAKHPNPMVRRQALHAARKLADLKLEERLRLVFEQCEEEDLKELFASIYGWRKKEQNAA